MDYLTIKTPNPECRLFWCFIEFIWLVGIFDSALWTIAPLTFYLVHLPLPSHLSKVKVQFIQTMCGWEGVEGGGGFECVGDYILQEFNTLLI